MSQSTSVEPRAPINWPAAIVLSLSFLAAITVVPYWGLTHGFSAGAWVFFVLFTGANGMAITGGYHRLWAHKTYEAHWVRATLIYGVRHHVPAEQRVLLGERPSHASPARR